MVEMKILTVVALAEHIASQLDLEHILAKRFPACNFGIIDVDGKTDFNQEELEFLQTGVSGWYGIKAVLTGFDSFDLVLIADYYGGSCAELAQLYDGISKEDAVKEICRIIVGCLEVQECADRDTTLFVEFDEPDEEEGEDD